MAVTIRTASWLRDLLGDQTEVKADGSTLKEAFASAGVLESLSDADGGIKGHFNVHVNGGEDVRYGSGLDTPLNDGDVVAIITPIAGGRGRGGA